jgi:hypothetical protein
MQYKVIDSTISNNPPIQKSSPFVSVRKFTDDEIMKVLWLRQTVHIQGYFLLKHSYFWIGANDIEIEYDWVWESDKSKLLFSDWHVGEPNNYDDAEDCGQIRWHNLLYRWNDDLWNSNFATINKSPTAWSLGGAILNTLW